MSILKRTYLLDLIKINMVIVSSHLKSKTTFKVLFVETQSTIQRFWRRYSYCNPLLIYVMINVLLSKL